MTSTSNTKLIKTTDPPSLDRYNWLIHLQHVRGETSECKNFIKKYVETSDMEHEYSLYKQGIISREEGHIQDALHMFQKCYQLNRNNATYIKEVAKCLFILSRYRLSLEAYLEAERVSEEPDWEIYNSIAECYMHLRDANSAKDYARKAIQYGKQDESYSLLTKIFDLEGDIRSAISVCVAAIGSCPDNIEMMTQLGMFYLRQRETQMAFEKFTTALEVDNECTKALLGVGCITQAHGEYDVALSKYKIALQHNPESVALWNNVGLCFYSKQKYVAAVTCLKRALWISPLNWKVLFNLGLVHIATQQSASAFNFLCASINIRPDVPFCFTALGYVLLELQDTENALRSFAQAEMISPEKPAIMVNLCVCLYLMGLHQDAFKKVEKVLALKTDDPVDKEAFDLALKLSSLLEDNQTSNETVETYKLAPETTSKDANTEFQERHDLQPDEV